MKTNLIRTMAIFVLATSISAFAQTADAKSENAATAGSPAQQNVSNHEATDLSEFNPSESNVSLALETLQEEVEQLQADDKANQEMQQKANQEKKNAVRQEDKSWDNSLLGIYGG
jgi:Skp family chaperone for outer membrane proteins